MGQEFAGEVRTENTMVEPRGGVCSYRSCARLRAYTTSIEVFTGPSLARLTPAS